MRIAVRDTELWFDVEGASLVPAGRVMHERPTIVLIHGGPGSYDHSSFKPDFARLARAAQVVYLDLRDHGRSTWGDPTAWTFEQCADDVAAFCDALGIVRPIVFGHSMGGFVAILYGARHPGHAGGLILQSTFARFDLERLVDGFRRNGGEDVAALARRDYAGEAIGDEDWASVFAAFGPSVPGPDALARRTRNPAVGTAGMDLMRRLDLIDQLPLITVPTLVCVGERDGPTPVPAAEEIVAGLAPGIGRLEVVAGAGHFPWLDAPEAYWPVIEGFVASVATRSR